MAHVESKETTDTNQKQVDGEKARELTDQELAKVSGGVRRLGGDNDLVDLEVER